MGFSVRRSLVRGTSSSVLIFELRYSCNNTFNSSFSRARFVVSLMRDALSSSSPLYARNPLHTKG